MKFRKVLTSLTAAASIAALFSVAPTTVSAASNSFKKPSSASIQKIEHAYVKNTPLTKQGYIIRVKDPVVKIMVGKENYERATKSAEAFKCKTISPKKVQNVKFRIEKVFTYRTPLFLVASKDKKYSAWATQHELEYYYLNSKSMQGVTKPLKRIANRYENTYSSKYEGNINAPKNKEDFQLAEKAAQKLKGSQKKFVVQSLKQLKKNGTMSIEGHNILLFGVY